MRRAAGGGAIALLALLVVPLIVEQSQEARRIPVRAGAARSSAHTLAALPVAARGTISRVLGRDLPRYRATSAGGTLSFVNDAQRLTARLSRRGVEVRAGEARVAMTVRAIGRGRRLTTVAAATPRARANRVVYRRGPLTEWYANGPLGLEQGFKLRRPPTMRGGALTLQLALSGTDVELLPGRLGLRLGAGLRYRGLLAADANGKRLRAWLELHPGSLLIRVADRGARYPVTIDPFVQQAKLVGADTALNYFGTSVAVSADTVVVGSPSATAGGVNNQGAAYVFVKPAGGWANGEEIAKLIASDGQSDSFAASVATSGDTVVVGAPNRDVFFNTNQGAVYVFVKPGGGWSGTQSQNAELSANDGALGDQLGFSVAVSGDTVVAGANGASTLRGAAYVFVKPGGGWSGAVSQSAKLTASDGAGDDKLGSSAAVSGDVVVAGAPGDDTNRGSAYLFVKPGGGWSGSPTETAKLTAADGAAGDLLGTAVGVSGDTVVAGAPGDDSGRGSAYVFVNAVQTAKLTASDGSGGDQLGSSVAVSGDTVVAGSPSATVSGRAQAGAAYVFVKPVNAWANGTEAAKLTAGPGTEGAEAGTSVAISGDTIAVGAPAVFPSCVYVFVKGAGGWTSGTETAKLNGNDVGDFFGYSVAIDGNTIVAGAPSHDGFNTTNEGNAYVFVKPAGGWVDAGPSATLQASGGTSFDELGISVAVSGDTVVAGAHGANAGEGAAYVYVKPGGGWSGFVSQTAKLTPSDSSNDALGESVAVSGDTVVAGAPSAAPSALNEGAVYVFVKPQGGPWVNATERAFLTALSGAAGDRLGASVALSGDVAIAGAPGDDSGSGSAYVFVKPALGWEDRTETARLTALDRAANDHLGASIALSGDTAVAGAPNDDSNQGSAYVFVKPAGPWTSATETQKLIAADGAMNDSFGSGVAVGGTAIVVGAPHAKVGTNQDAGAAYVFQQQGATAVRVIAFAARRAHATIVVRWRTGSESDVSGFNVYRERAGRLLRVNRSVVMARGSGSAYIVVDRATLRSGSMRYLLQGVRLDGTRVWLAATRA